MACFRCGRKSHYANNCFAKTTIRGVVIESDNDSYSEQSEEEEHAKKRKHASNSNPTTISRVRAGIYVLKAASGLYYVGCCLEASRLSTICCLEASRLSTICCLEASRLSTSCCLEASRLSTSCCLALCKQLLC
jgi:hypothetical protein